MIIEDDPSRQMQPTTLGQAWRRFSLCVVYLKKGRCIASKVQNGNAFHWTGRNIIDCGEHHDWNTHFRVVSQCMRWQINVNMTVSRASK